MVASKLKGPAGPLIEVPKLSDHLLKCAVLYGANASGKSRVLDALEYMRWVVVSSHRAWKPGAGISRAPFKLDEGSDEEGSLFEVALVADGVEYEYGFVVDSDRVLEEWLFAYPKGARQRWFTREADEFDFGRELSGEKKSIQALTRPNSLFLSAAAQNNHRQLLPIFAWFSDALRPISAGESQPLVQEGAKRLKRDPDLRDRVVELLQVADLGVIGLEVVEREIGDDPILEAIRSAVEDPDVVFDSVIAEVRLSHRAASASKGVQLDFRHESRGTQQMFALAGPLLEALDRGSVLLIDELDASLHPLLAMKVVELFNTRETNPHGAQLVCNTHDTNLLSSDEVLRRDQIWFTEKDKEGVSHLYPLTDYKPRGPENLEKGYLQGRYGALPFLGAMSRFLTQEHSG